MVLSGGLLAGAAGATASARPGESRVTPPAAVDDRPNEPILLRADPVLTELVAEVTAKSPAIASAREATVTQPLDARRQDARLNRVRLSVTAAVRRAFSRLLLARETLRLVDEQRENLIEIEKVTRSMYEAGRASQLDLLRAQTEVTRIEQARLGEEGSAAMSQGELNRLLGRPMGTPVPETEGLAPIAGRPVVLPDLLKLLALGDSVCPELLLANLAIERSRAAVDLARRRRLPEMLEKEARVRSEEAAREDLRLRIRVATERAYGGMSVALRRVNGFVNGILVQDQLAVEAAMSSYRTGRVSFLSVLEAHSTRFADQRSMFELFADALTKEANLYEFLPGDADGVSRAAAPQFAPPIAAPM
jgi:outer membrane protein TolC